MFNEDLFDGKLTLNLNEDKKHFTIQMTDPETGNLDFLVKAKFLQLNDSEPDSADKADSEANRIRLRLVKKRGDLHKWYEVLSEMMELGFDQLLLAPLNQNCN